MQYGYFDLANKEYVITRPDTPSAWANYLGSPEYGAIISNNAGGYSFVKSGANGRITRYRFNSNMALPGRYIYLRDNDANDYWSASWQPVGKPLDTYKSTCRHGTAYTVISAEYSGIRSDVTYYVPDGATHEVWRAIITNNSDRPRNLSAFGFVEFTNEDNYEQDQVNLQYSLFISRTAFEQNKMMQYISEYSEKDATSRFFGMVGAPITAYNGSLEHFIGSYRTYSNPIAVESGHCDNELNYNSNSCGALQTELTLQPGESKELIFVLGRKTSAEADEILHTYETAGKVDAEVAALKQFWHEKLNHFSVETPSEAFNNMINVWNAYQCFITFIWSRAASFIYCGLRNGYGYRDTVQDIQGVIHLAPEMALEKIRFMLSAQVDNGGGLPLVKFTHNAGHEDTPDDASYVQETGHPAYRADDALWLFPTVYKYIAESGNLAFIDEVIPFANKDEATVYEHLKRALAFSVNHLGPHGLPAGLYADWNDCLRLGKNGESSFVALQFYYAMTILKQFAAYKEDQAYMDYLEEEQKKLGTLINNLCWNEDRFIRGFTEAGEVIGKRTDPEANMWLNPQSWAVISGLATKQQAELSMENVRKRLNTEYGAILMDPPYHLHAFDGALAVIYNPGTKENAGIFSQSQGWLILAEALLGHGDQAFTYFMENAPSAQNDRAEIRKLEPYCYGQFTEGKDSPHFGRSHVHWLTGTASTVMVGCVEGILGMRPDFGGLRIAPSIPADWDQFTIEKDFRGKHLHIVVENPEHVQSGCKALYVNEEKMEDNYIPVEKMTDQTKVRLVMA